MGPDGVFRAEMPEPGGRLADPLDDNTVERLVAGRMDPDDAPPGYAGVARVLRAAAGPAGPEELAGREAALAMFRAHGPSSGARRRRRGRARGRVVALALAGVVAAGGLWMADGARTGPGLRSPTGGAGAGGAGSGTSGSGVAGLVNQARATAPPVPGAGANGRAAVGPTTGERPTARHGAGVGSGAGAAHGSKPDRPGMPPKPQPKPKPDPGPMPDPGPKPNAGPKPNGASSLSGAPKSNDASKSKDVCRPNSTSKPNGASSLSGAPSPMARPAPVARQGPMPGTEVAERLEAEGRAQPPDSLVIGPGATRGLGPRFS